MNTFKILNRSNGTLVGDSIVSAETMLSRIVGLLGKTNLQAGEGLWIRPSSGIHTFAMRVTIDAVGLDEHMRVVKLWRCLKPFRITTLSFKLHSVLELAAGEIDARLIRPGDLLEAVPASGEKA